MPPSVANLRFREIPGVSPLFLDFVEGGESIRPFLPDHPDLGRLYDFIQGVKERNRSRDDLCQLLYQRAGGYRDDVATMASIDRLSNPRAVVVLVSHAAGLLGGPLSALLKCLTAARLAGELQKEDCAAVPVCWIDTGAAPADARTIRLLDADVRLHDFSLAGTEGNGRDPVPPQIESLFLQAHDLLGHGMLEPEIAAAIRDCYSTGVTFAAASARLLSVLMEGFGLVILDPGESCFRPILESSACTSKQHSEKIASLLKTQQRRLADAGYESPDSGGRAGRESAMVLLSMNSILPVAAIVGSAEDIYLHAVTGPLYPELQMKRPLIWPSLSATIVDARSRKTLERYGIGFPDLFEGSEALLHKIGMERVLSGTQQRLEAIAAEVEARTDELAGILTPEDELSSALASARMKMLYQVRKLGEKVVAAGRRKQDAAARQVERVCNTLAPRRRRQEEQLASYQFIHRYSRTILRILYEKTDLGNFEHQLLQVD